MTFRSLQSGANIPTHDATSVVPFDVFTRNAGLSLELKWWVHSWSAFHWPVYTHALRALEFVEFTLRDSPAKPRCASDLRACLLSKSTVLPMM